MFYIVTTRARRGVYRQVAVCCDQCWSQLRMSLTIFDRRTFRQTIFRVEHSETPCDFCPNREREAAMARLGGGGAT